MRLTGYVETSGADLDAPPSLLSLFEDFIHWQPIPPRDAKQLAEVSARLCRLLREEVTEQLAIGSPALATDWRKLLFPEASNAMGRGGWIEASSANSPESAPLSAWTPPPEWGVGAHTKHLRNLYVYFWRWATWKVFDHDPTANTGIVCFITVAGFLNGPGFEKMRDYLRRTTDEMWVIDCSPEGHQPEVNTRIFEAV